MQGSQDKCVKNLIVGNTKSRKPLRSGYENAELWVQEGQEGCLSQVYSERKRSAQKCDRNHWKFPLWEICAEGELQWNCLLYLQEYLA